MRNLTEQSITDTVLERFSSCRDARLKQVITSLIRHLHQFAREVQLTPEEWRLGIDFLTDAGHITDDKRQEFILLSDTLGLSALVDLIKNRGKPAEATESSLLGPFYREGAPEMALGASVARDIEGEPVVLRGRVTSLEGRAISGALLDVWQAAPSGFYDLQDERMGINLRGRFRTDAEGRFYFRSVKPASYPVPFDGPVGRMLKALGRHPYRPAHIHFIVSAEGFESLTTALYIDGDEYLDSDAVFGARKSLVVRYRPGEPAGADKSADASRMDSIEFDVVLNPGPR